MLVQFGNNWIQKIPLTAKLDSAYGLVQFWLSSEFFSSIYFQIRQAYSPITYTNRGHNKFFFKLIYFLFIFVIPPRLSTSLVFSLHKLLLVLPLEGRLLGYGRANKKLIELSLLSSLSALLAGAFFFFIKN